MDKKTKKKAFWCLGLLFTLGAGYLGYRNRDKITDVFNKKRDN